MKKRNGFTLIELLMVLGIIATLSALLLAAVNKVLTKLPETDARVEISQLDGSIAAFMSDYKLQYPPPSYILLREDNQYNRANPIELATVKWLQTWLGRTFNFSLPVDWNGNGVTDLPYILEGDQCLVLWTGGIPTYSTGSISMKGFNPSNYNPSAPSIQRRGPYMSFNSSRLVLRGSFPVYLDAWRNKTTAQPYAYFSSQGNFNGYNGLGGMNLTGPTGDCGTIGASPYYQLSIGTPPFPSYLNGNRYQIISAGKDGLFAADNIPPFPGVQWQAVDGSFSKIAVINSYSKKPVGYDDQANFSSTLLGIGQH